MKVSVNNIRGYHAHIYYDLDSRENAEQVRSELDQKFDVLLGRWHDVPVGPHTAAMFQIAFTPNDFEKIVPWLMLNRLGLDILLHPETENDLADHTEFAVWLGNKLDLHTDRL